MKPDVLRIARAFACASRPADLNILLNMKIHFLNYGKIGEQYERLLRDIEMRTTLEVQKFDNFFADREKEAIQKYIDVTTKEITNDNDSSSEEKKAVRKAKG
jgi:hypothetical protein